MFRAIDDYKLTQEKKKKKNVFSEENEINIEHAQTEEIIMPKIFMETLL